LRRRRDREPGAESDAPRPLGREKCLDPAERASRDDEAPCVDEGQRLRIRDTGELIIELLSLVETHEHRPLGSVAFGSCRIQRVDDVTTFRTAVPAAHRREYRESRGHEHRSDGIELRTSARVLLASVIPDDGRKGPVAGGMIRVAGER
jgi:hypothetical protein